MEKTNVESQGNDLGNFSILVHVVLGCLTGESACRIQLPKKL